MGKALRDELNTLKTDVKRRALMIFIQLLFGLALLLGISGNLSYVGAWLLGGLYL